jgi:hypothetical protein
MTDIMTDVADFFNGLVGVIIALLMPASGSTTLSPLQIVMWAGLILGFLTFVVSLIKRLASQG